MTPTDATVDALAVYRLTRIIVDDEIVEDQRQQAIAWLDRHDMEKVSYLIGCYWCSGFWVSIICALIRSRLPRLWRAVRWPLAASAVTGILAETI